MSDIVNPPMLTRKHVTRNISQRHTKLRHLWQFVARAIRTTKKYMTKRHVIIISCMELRASRMCSKTENLLQIIYIDLAFEYGNCFVELVTKRFFFFISLMFSARQGVIAKWFVQVSHFDTNSIANTHRKNHTPYLSRENAAYSSEAKTFLNKQ